MVDRQTDGYLAVQVQTDRQVPGCSGSDRQTGEQTDRYLGVQVPVQQVLDRSGWGDRLGEAVPAVLAVLQGPVPDRGEGGVRRVRVPPALDGGVGLTMVLDRDRDRVRVRPEPEPEPAQD